MDRRQRDGTYAITIFLCSSSKSARDQNGGATSYRATGINTIHPSSGK